MLFHTMVEFAHEKSLRENNNNNNNNNNKNYNSINIC